MQEWPGCLKGVPVSVTGPVFIVKTKNIVQGVELSVHGYR